MAIYLYCLLRAASDPPPDLLGIDGLPVRGVDAAGLRAWVSDTADTAIVASPERARAHDAVVRAALARETPLPARFGQVVADHAALEEVVSSRRGAFDAALDSVAGAVEMTLRVLIPVDADRGDETTPPRSSTTTGRGQDYLRRLSVAHRQERNVRAEEQIVRERVSSAVGSLVRAESFAGARSGSSIATISHLVPRDCIEAYRSAIQALRADDPALALMVSGPWAPYSFTQVGSP